MLMLPCCHCNLWQWNPMPLKLKWKQTTKPRSHPSHFYIWVQLKSSNGSILSMTVVIGLSLCCQVSTVPLSGSHGESVCVCCPAFPSPTNSQAWHHDVRWNTLLSADTRLKHTHTHKQPCTHQCLPSQCPDILSTAMVTLQNHTDDRQDIIKYNQ